MNATNESSQRIDDALGDGRVFALPVTVAGVTVITASRVSDVIARPAGAIVIDRGRVRRKLTLGVTWIVLGGQLVGLAYFVSTWLIARSNARAAIEIARAG